MGAFVLSAWEMEMLAGCSSSEVLFPEEELTVVLVSGSVKNLVTCAYWLIVRLNLSFPTLLAFCVAAK